MEKSNIMIRLEKKEEYQKVENLVRESFWNVYRPGCLEHYVLHQLRNDPAFEYSGGFSRTCPDSGNRHSGITEITVPA